MVPPGPWSLRTGHALRSKRGGGYGVWALLVVPWAACDDVRTSYIRTNTSQSISTNGSWLMVQGSWLMAKEKRWGTPDPIALAPLLFLWHEHCAMSL